MSDVVVLCWPSDAEDVIRLRGSVRIEHTLARLGAEKLSRLLAEEDYVNALGALTGGQFAPSLAKATPIQVAEAIRVGPGLMPAFPDTVLDAREVNAIAEYVRALQGRHTATDRAGLPLGRIGPVTEGVVGWAVGLLLLVLVVRWLGSLAR